VGLLFKDSPQSSRILLDLHERCPAEIMFSFDIPQSVDEGRLKLSLVLSGPALAGAKHTSHRVQIGRQGRHLRAAEEVQELHGGVPREIDGRKSCGVESNRWRRLRAEWLDWLRAERVSVPLAETQTLEN
jgi:hypothetical protein